MTPLDDHWSNEAAAFIRAFAERAATWDEHPGDLAAGDPEPWTDPDHPDPVLDAASGAGMRAALAYRGGIVSAVQRGNAGGDNITILRARGRRLAKLIARDGTITDYEGAKHFDLAEIPVDGLDQLEEDLRRLLHQPDRCIVRGQIAEIGRSRGVRRLLRPEGEDPASLVDVPRRWLGLDIDGLARPVNVAAADLVACAGIAIAALPPAFHAARCVVQATAGHGYKPGLRLRLWYWLDRPVSGAELKRWLAPELVDHALFGAAQPIYIAAPVFAARRDPLPNRLLRLPIGDACVAVPDIPEPEQHIEPAPVKPANGLSRYAEVALDNECRRIAGAGAKERDRAVNSASYAIGRLAGAGAIPEAFARRALHHAASQIPGYDKKRDRDKVERSFRNGMQNPREASHG